MRSDCTLSYGEARQVGSPPVRGGGCLGSPSTRRGGETRWATKHARGKRPGRGGPWVYLNPDKHNRRLTSKRILGPQPAAVSKSSVDHVQPERGKVCQRLNVLRAQIWRPKSAASTALLLSSDVSTVCPSVESWINARSVTQVVLIDPTTVPPMLSSVTPVDVSPTGRSPRWGCSADTPPSRCSSCRRALPDGRRRISPTGRPLTWRAAQIESRARRSLARPGRRPTRLRPFLARSRRLVGSFAGSRQRGRSPAGLGRCPTMRCHTGGTSRRRRYSQKLWTAAPAQAACFLSPSTNTTPSIRSLSFSLPFSFRQPDWAFSASLNAMANAARREPGPLVR